MEERIICVGGRVYRLRLEGVFWEHLEDFAGQRRVPLDRLVGDIVGDDRDPSSALRVYVLSHFRALAGHSVEIGNGASSCGCPPILH